MRTSDKSETADSARILAIGDIHLGTRCSGLPDEILDWGIDPNDLSPAAALTMSVDFAIEQKVDAVLFAGDVVESTNDRFEAIPPLEKNVRRLIDEDIQGQCQSKSNQSPKSRKLQISSGELTPLS